MKGWSPKKRRDEPQRRRVSAEEVAERKQSEHRGQQLFRRNRTLVGSVSSRVSSASELTGGLKSPRTHAHNLTAHRRMLGISFLFVVGMAGLLTWLLYEFTASIHVSPSNGLVIEQARYQQAITGYLNAHPLERLRFLQNDKELTRYLNQTVPEVERVYSNGAAGFATGQFDIVFRRPVASWLIADKQYFVDENGVSFQANYYDDPGVKIIDQSGVPQTTGTTVASSRFLRFVGRSVTLAKLDKLVITQAIIPASTTHQIDVMLEGRPYPIKLSLDRPVGEQVEDMAHAVAYFDSRGVRPEYVDVRVSGKAYYK